MFVNDSNSKKRKSIKQENKNKVNKNLTCGSNDDYLNISDEPDLDIEPGHIEPDLNDAICIFCDVMFSNDKKGELWIQCLVCHLWAHNECAGPESDHYTCDFCK